MSKGVFTCAAALGLGLAGFAVVPNALHAAGLAFSARDEVAVADYRLASATDLNVYAAIESALAEGDTELAQSLAELAGSSGIAIAPAHTQRIAAAVDAAGGQVLSDAWTGFTTGDTSSEAALAGSLGADFSGYGDIRDLYEQVGNYQQGKPVDDLVVGLAAAGLALTGATIVSLGSASPAKAGVSVVKSARRAGKLSPALTRQVSRLAGEMVDRKALDTLAGAVGRFDIAAARTAAVAVVRPSSLKAITRLGEDLTTVGRATGYRGMMQTLKLAKSSDEVGQVAKLSGRFGTRTRGALALIGGAALSFGSIALTAGAWLATGLIWFIVFALAVARTAVWLMRGLWWLIRPAPVRVSGALPACRS